MSETGARPGDQQSIPPTQIGAIFVDVLREMRAQRESMERVHRSAEEERRTAEKERRSHRRWKFALQSILFGGPTLIALLYFGYFVVATSSFSFGPIEEVVGVIKIKGEMVAGGAAGADRVVPVLQKAFESQRVKAIVLDIDSPGGAPLESERIYSALTQFKKKHPKPIVSVIENVGASAAYLVAIHTDTIIAGNYSLVGSIGVIIEGWDLHRAAERLSIGQRVYSSGALKSMLHPFLPMTPAADKKAKELVSGGGAAFAETVRSLRGDKLKRGVEFSTGEVWYGKQALEIGLIDEIGTIDELIANRFGLPAHSFGPVKQGGGLFSSLSDTMAEALVSRLLSAAQPTLR